MSAVVYAFGARESAPRPWENHELAELYRVVDLLGKAGLAVDTDMGMSDEGDPWFVFCRVDTTDVVVHIARIGGQYVAASAVVDQAFRGGNFRELIDQLVRQQPLVMPPPSAGGKLFLHPAVLLTAFVATALLHSHRADAADGINPAVPVTLPTDKHGDAGGVSTVLKLLLTEPTKASLDKNALKLSASSTPSTSLASLMAIAISLIAPLVDQSLDIASIGTDLTSHTMVMPAVSPAALVVTDVNNSLPSEHVAAQDRLISPVDMSTDAIGHDKAAAPTSLTQVSLAALNAQPLHVETTIATTTPSAFADTTGLSDHLLTHPIMRPMGVAADGSTGTDGTHHIALSDVDVAAIEVLSLRGITKSDSSAATWLGTQTTTVTNTTSNAANPTPADVTVNIDGTNPTALLNALSDFTYSTSTQHEVTGALHASSYLSLALSAYSQLTGGSVKLIIFHDPNAAFTIFPFVKGVLFVEDTEISSTPATLHGTSADAIHLAGGETMTLIGVITVDATHPLAS